MKTLLCFSVLTLLPLRAQVRIRQHDSERISVDINGGAFSEFFIGSDTQKPYLHPLRSASGKIVTREYPMKTDVPGESHDHPHHRGLWFTHGDVNGYDFWGNEPSQKGANKGKGRVVLERVAKVSSGKDSGSIHALFRWVDGAGKAILEEDRTMLFRGDATTRQMDFDIKLKALDKVTFGDTKEGTFAIRLAAGLEEPHPKAPSEPKRTGKMVNAQGAEGEKQVWGKRSEWVDYFGELDGEKLGIAIFDHPSNPRHPTYWHSRSYGLFAANIFGVHDFENDKSKDGSMTIEPGQVLRFRYQVLIHPGDYRSAGIGKLYQEYAR